MTKIFMANNCSKCSSSYAVMTDGGRLNCTRCGMSRGTLATPIRNFIDGCAKQFGPLDASVLMLTKPPVEIAVNDCAESSDGKTAKSKPNDK